MDEASCGGGRLDISRATSGQRVTGENCSVTEAATLTTSSPETGSLVAGVDLVSDTAHIFTETTQTPPYCSGCRVNHDAVNDVGDSNDQGNTNNTNDLDGLSSQEEVSDQANMNNAIDQAITTDQVGPTTKREDTNQPTLHLNYSPCEENETPTTTQPPTANSSRPPNQTEVTAPPEHQPAVSAELKNQIMDHPRHRQTHLRSCFRLPDLAERVRVLPPHPTMPHHALPPGPQRG